jgi:alpha-L-rhamnosidase
VLRGALVALLLLSASSGASSASSAADPAPCDGWADNVIGPGQRALKPVAGRWLDAEQLGDTDLASLRDMDGASVHLSRGLVLDFGEVVSGKIEADLLEASGGPIRFSTSESLEYLSIGSDTLAYGNGDVLYQPGGGRERWHAFTRRTFRYLLVTLAQPGWADVDSIGVYFTAALGPPSAFKGWFLSSEPLLNRIWYRSAYTLQLVSAAGSANALDGTLEVWRGWLDMAGGSESRLLLARAGADWRDVTFDFDLTIPPGSTGGGWAIRATPDAFVAFRLAPPGGNAASGMQVWLGTRRGAAALVETHPFDVRRGRPYHIRVDVAGNQIVTSVDRQIVSTDTTLDLAAGTVGFWAAAGDQFNIAHPRVFSANGALLLEDNLDGGPYLDPARWAAAPQPLLLDGAKRDRAVGLADLAIAARGEYLSFGDWAWIGRQLASAAAHQYADGKLSGGLLSNDTLAPEDERLPDYTLWWVLAVGDYVQYSGDVQAVGTLFPHVQSAVTWAERRRQADGLARKGPGEDWYWSAPRGSGPTTSFNALYAGSLMVAADLADLLRLDPVRDRYLAQAAEVRAAINARLWDDTAEAYVDGDLHGFHPLDGNALAVLFGVATGERATHALSFIQDRLWTPAGTLAADQDYGGWAQDGAIWPAYVYPEVEARFSVNDDANALELVRRTWGSMLAHDPASTFWEFATRDGGVRDGSTSLTHGWSTGALPALSRWVLGIRPMKPGYAEYTIAPHPGDLVWVCGAVPTPAGAIRARWERGDARFTLWLEAPAGTSGTFIVPAGWPDQLLLDGQPAAASPLAGLATGLAGLSPGPHTIEVVLDPG